MWFFKRISCDRIISARNCMESNDLDLADSFSRDFLIFFKAMVFVLFPPLLFHFLLNTENVALYAPSNLRPSEQNRSRHHKRGRVLPQQVHSEHFQRPMSWITEHFKIFILTTTTTKIFYTKFLFFMWKNYRSVWYFSGISYYNSGPIITPVKMSVEV